MRKEIQDKQVFSQKSASGLLLFRKKMYKLQHILFNPAYDAAKIILTAMNFQITSLPCE
ncbi:hypothetical protein UNDYM_5251 [Undibacterium sp. YM2]|uniref:hypothetical protein n=1 Tax=Undibacterium sp. YM2 TaxID=2058625 RepID=UPI001331D3DC|nr:hypothetical protein [Undibacterium sp. YM2]BBB69504.1 hypothetical protein UNDYM_5251 [Undibacterium sp. YM2]